MELLDNYLKQVAPVCRDCPILRASIELSIIAEAGADRNTEKLKELIDTPVGSTAEISEAFHAAYGTFLDIHTSQELRAAKYIGTLTGGTPCKGTKRGAPAVYPLRWRVLDFIMNKRVCNNANLHELFNDENVIA